jgi:tetraacyldisaccharide 4'-kinase
MRFGAAVARRLEGRGFEGRVAEVAARVWGGVARVEVGLRWREGARVVVIGGSTLGGSGKTPLAIACAEELHDAGMRVALVGHAYGASPREARFVRGDEDVRLVGDEALSCQRHLADKQIPVAVAPKRQQALDFGLSRADVAIVDGPCQTKPQRAALALLAVDATDPWGGGGRCPPRGDLRAPMDVLLAAVDRVVAIAPEGSRVQPLEETCVRPVDHVWANSNGAILEGRTIDWNELRGCRIGLWTAIARPHRVVRELARRGVHPAVVQACADHGPAELPTRGTGGGIDLWLCTSKCRGHLPETLSGVPVATLDYTLRLEGPLKAALARLDPESAHP